MVNKDIDVWTRGEKDGWKERTTMTTGRETTRDRSFLPDLLHSMGTETTASDGTGK